MLVLSDFFDCLLRGTTLVSLSLVLGSTLWGWWVLRAPQGRAPAMAVTRCLTLMVAGAGALAIGQVLLLTFKAQVLAESLGAGALSDFIATQHFTAGAARTLLAVA